MAIATWVWSDASRKVLVHTPLMEVAHERHFVVGEMKQSINDFELEHLRRIGQTIALWTKFTLACHLS